MSAIFRDLCENVVRNSYCDGEVLALWEESFKATKQTPDDIARKTLRAVERNMLYVFPHLHGKMFWYQKRLFLRIISPVP